MKTLGVIVLASIILMVIGTWFGRIRTRRIAYQREGETFNDFAAYFDGRNVPYAILKNTHRYFEEWNSDSRITFPVRATDNIYGVYGIVDECLDDAVEEILKKSGRRFPTKEEMPQSPHIEFIEDVVSYVAASPESENSNV